MKPNRRLRASAAEPFLISRLPVAVWVFLCLCLSCAHLHAFEVGPAQIEIEPYVKGGTIAWDQLSGTGGHKSLVGLGVNGIAAFGRVGGALNAEKWWVAEGLDDDKGIIPDTGYRFSADVRYLFTPADDLRLYPFAGLGYEHWSRSDAVGSWRSIDFPFASLGAGVDYRSGFFKIGVLMPFAATADDGPDPKSRVGVTADAGLRIFNCVLGMFFRSVGFESPDAKMVQAGVMVGYTLK